MKAGIDIDGVLADFLHEVKYVFGEPDVPSAYSLEEMYPMRRRSEILDLVRNANYISLPTIPGALSGIRCLRKRGVEIIYITARPPEVLSETVEWLRIHRFPKCETVFVSPKSKPSYAEINGLDFFVEDNLETARAMARVCLSILLNAPYNQGPTGDAIRLQGWPSICEFMRKYK